MVKKGDFIELSYTGKLTNGTVFDTTDPAIAKEAKLQQSPQGSIIVRLGEGHLIAGLDKHLEGKELGKHPLSLPKEEAFGVRDAKLIQLIPTQKLLQHNIKPVPGLQLQLDGTICTVKSVSGGRTICDFNHPLAGQDVVYEADIIRLVDGIAEQVRAMLWMETNHKFEVSEQEGKIAIKGVPKELHEAFQKRVKDVFSKEVLFH